MLDTTGAGDSFCGGLAAGLAAGEPITEAVRRGCVSASFAVESFGSMSLATVDPGAAAARLAGATSGPPVSTVPSVASERYDIAVMMDEIGGIPEVVKDHLSDPLGAVQRVVDLLVAGEIEHLYLTGCGDSAFAASASMLAFAEHAGADAEEVHALTLARYRRVICRRGRQCWASPSQARPDAPSKLCPGRAFRTPDDWSHQRPQSCPGARRRHVLPIEVPTLGFSPGTSTYLGMLAHPDGSSPALGYRSGAAILGGAGICRDTA